jgi:hypothetical protein
MARPDTVYARALLRAADIVGGPKILAGQFKVPSRVLQRWLDGSENPSFPYFLRAVDIIVAEKLRTTKLKPERESREDVNRPPT